MRSIIPGGFALCASICGYADRFRAREGAPRLAVSVLFLRVLFETARQGILIWRTPPKNSAGTARPAAVACREGFSGATADFVRTRTVP
jgi:hypothetical protein